MIAGTHVNPHLQSAWNKHGKEQFEFSVLEECDKSQIRLREQDILDKADKAALLNVSKHASGGDTLSDTQKAERSLARSEMNKKMWEERRAAGWKMSDESSALTSQSLAGKKRPQHVIDALTASHKGKPSPLKGTTHSDEVKKRRSDSLKEYHRKKRESM